MNEIKLYDVVALLEDIPAEGLRRGDVGTVIEIFEANEKRPKGYMLEFVDEQTGSVYAEMDITDESEIVVVHFRKQATQSKAGRASAKQSQPKPRVLGGNRGWVAYMSEDFNAPLPDEFWSGDE